MAGNKSLTAAARARQDEFYTQLTDIEKELRHYRQHFRGKTVFCNCDDPFESNFFKYFVLNFNRLGLKKLIATCYAGSPIAGTQLSMFGIHESTSGERNTPYKAVVTTVYDKTGDGGVDMTDVAELFKSGENELTELSGDGDFRSSECLAILDEADIVVTNPPFSLFREYIAALTEHKKSFLIIGNQNAITYKEVFHLMMTNQIWLGVSSPKEFVIPANVNDRKNTYSREDGTILAKFGNVCWFTNLDIKKRHEELILTRRYHENEFNHYTNYDAIEVSRISDIPCDYDGIMGVPITMFINYNPDQFEILGRSHDIEWAEKECSFFIPPDKVHREIYKAYDRTWRMQIPYWLDEKQMPSKVYLRIFIRNKHPEPPKEAQSHAD